jgi:hypothetical protein
MLAVIAASTDHCISRSRLRALFWGNSEPKKAAGSLRSALKKMRNSFERLGQDLFLIRNTHIGLAKNCWVVRRDVTSDTFLEGMDLKAAGAEGFEEWLREERTALQQSSSWHAPDSDRQTLRPQLTKGLSLGILPTVSLDKSKAMDALVAPFFEDLQLALSHLSNVSIFNLTGEALEVETQPPLGTDSQAMMLKSVVSERDYIFTLHLSLIAPLSGRVIKTIAPVHLRHQGVQADVVGIAELILSVFSKEIQADQNADLMPWAVLSSLFSLDVNAVATTEDRLDRLLTAQPSSVLKCLKVFSQIFKENEGLAPKLAYSRAEMVRTLEEVPSENPHRPLCESLLGYAAHMLNADNELSTFLLRIANQRAPNLALNLDHLAVLKLAEGDLRAASEVHMRCMACGGLSSWRYSYDVTGAMIAIAVGDFRTALRRSNQSLMQKPRFVGALRYTMIGFAMNDSPENAKLMKSRIAKLRPDYNLSAWVEAFLKRSDPVFANNVAITLQRQDLV